MNQTRAGVGYGIAAYLMWGLFPPFFTLLKVVNPFEVVSWRVMATLLICAALVTITGRVSRISAILKQPKRLGLFALSGLLLYVNWQMFVIGVVTGHVLETSLGYFINPVFTVLFGVIFWRERLTRLQWCAIIIAAAGVLTSAIAYGTVPWIALSIALSFGLYGVVRQRMQQVDGITGLTVETLVTCPIGVVQLFVVAGTAGIGGFAHGPLVSVLVLGSGVMTAVPLILFGESARRLPLIYIGFLQFLTPVLSFIFGYFVLHEPLRLENWIGFVAVWLALLCLITDMLLRLGRARHPAAAITPHTGPIPLD